MLEPRRQSFLDAMGVVSYVPRFVLPNARPSARCEMPVPPPGDVRSEAPARAAPPVGGTAGVGPEAPAVRPAGEARQRVEMPSIQAPSAPTKPAAAPPAEAVRFAADLVTTQLGLMFLCEGSLRPEQKRLVANIAAAFSRHFLPDQEAGLQASRFSWPVLQSAGLAQGADAARDALSANVLAQAERLRMKWVVVFGDGLLPYLDSQLLAQEGVLLVPAAELAELLQSAAAKAALWRALQDAVKGGTESP